MARVLDTAGWTPLAREVLTRACNHYGGLQTWRALRRVRLVPERLSGFVPRFKGVGRSFPLPSAIDVIPHERQTRFFDYPDREHFGVFDDGAVRIEHRSSGRVVAADEHRRESLCEFGLFQRWNPLDALYFFGYALSHYHALPFTLVDARLLSVTAASQSCPFDVLEVELPADVPSHCRRQTFYFDADGQLTRHDYHAEVVGVWARGAHFWKRQTRINGMPISFERHVFARLGRTPSPLTALRASFTAAEVELDSSQAIAR